MTDCLFCQIVSGKIPSYKIYEDHQTFAFLDIHPQVTGHTLIIPKTHAPFVWDMPDPGILLTTAKLLIPHLKQVLKTEIIYASIMGEQVPHAHLHLLPQNVSLKSDLTQLQTLLTPKTL